MNWAPVMEEWKKMGPFSMQLLATELLPKFLNSKMGQALIMKIRERELAGQTGPLKTVALGLDKTSENYWLEMFKVLS